MSLVLSGNPSQRGKAALLRVAALRDTLPVSPLERLGHHAECVLARVSAVCLVARSVQDGESSASELADPLRALADAHARAKEECLAAAPELRVLRGLHFHNGTVDFEGVAAPCACEAAVELAESVLSTAYAAGAGGGERPASTAAGVPGQDDVERLAQLDLPDLRRLRARVLQEVAAAGGVACVEADSYAARQPTPGAADEQAVPSPEGTPSGRPGRKSSPSQGQRMDCWAIGCEHPGSWAVFQQYQGQWRHKGKFELAKGAKHDEPLLEAFAEGGGHLSKFDAIKTVNLHPSATDAERIFTSIIKPAMSRLRAKIRTALGFPKGVDPLLWDTQTHGWRAEIQIGYAIPVDSEYAGASSTRLTFRLKEELGGGDEGRYELDSDDEPDALDE